jgi:hypothetical protein
MGPVPENVPWAPDLVRIRTERGDFRLRRGKEMVIGRGPDCDVVVLGTGVSRRHARIVVAGEGVFVEDLGSRNGVFVGGKKITGRHALADSDRILVGDHELWIYELGGEADLARAAMGRERQTLPQIAEDGATLPVSALSLIGAAAMRSLAAGRTSEAEELLRAEFRGLRRKKDQPAVDRALIHEAAGYAIRLAAATAKGSYVDYVFELYTEVAVPMPASHVNELLELVRRIPISLPILRRYVDRLETVSSSLGPADRFLLNRLAALEAVAAAR